MSDLIKRLRDLAEDLQIVPGIDTESSELVYRAASRIEELEGALRDFVQHAVDSGWDGPMIERARELLK